MIGTKRMNQSSDNTDDVYKLNFLERVVEKQIMQDNPRWRLACKAVVEYGMKEGEMIVRVNPKQL